MNVSSHSFVKRSALFACLFVGAVASNSLCARGQRIGMPDGFDAGKRAEAMSMITSGTLTNEKLLKDYFQSLFADLTNPDKAKDMHKTRLQMKSQLNKAGNAADKSVHDAANRIMLEILPKIITNARFQPGVRFNCALLLADLDSVEKVGLDGTATPMPAALDKLIALLSDPKANDSISLAALNGLSRFAMTGDDATRAKVAKAGLAYLDHLDKSDSAARKQEVKYWLEARTMDTLGDTRAPSPELVAAFQTRLADENRPLYVRCQAAQSLGELQFTAESKVDANALFPDFKKLVEAALEKGLSRREIRYALYSVRRGLVGYAEPQANSLQQLLSGDAKKQEAAMTLAIADIVKICEKKETTNARVPLEIEKVKEKWQSGGFDGKEVDAATNEALREGSSGSDDTEEAPAEDATPAEPGDVDDSIFGE